MCDRDLLRGSFCVSLARAFAMRLVILALSAALPGAGQAQVALASDLEKLVQAYPDFLDRIEGNALVWKDGTRMVIDDGKGEKDFETRLNEPDIKDMFVSRYVAGKPESAPTFQNDPGRVRYQPLFEKMYGDCRTGEVEKRLVTIEWLSFGGQPQKIKVSKVNGVADRLTAVANELARLPPELQKFLTPSAGTFNCRPIAGTNRISAHGQGIAIDINVDASDYWRWAKADANGRFTYRNRIPWEVVEIFERHGFIWGGKWYHFDTMHFEYRPELLPARQTSPRR